MPKTKRAPSRAYKVADVTAIANCDELRGFLRWVRKTKNRRALIALHNHFNPGKPVNLAMYDDYITMAKLQFAVEMDVVLNLVPEKIRDGAKKFFHLVVELRNAINASSDPLAEVDGGWVAEYPLLKNMLDEVPPNTLERAALMVYLLSKIYRAGPVMLPRFTEHHGSRYALSDALIGLRYPRGDLKLLIELLNQEFRWRMLVLDKASA